MPESSRLSLPVVAERASPAAPACRDAAEPHPDEFPHGSSVWDDRLSRRNFLSITAASSVAVLAGAGCSDRPTEPIVPYVDPPEQVLPGEPQFFATTLTRNGYGRGVIVTSREGRPVKIEGNPDHPASLGAADAQMQAAVLGLYDPRRSKQVTHAGVPTTWGDFAEALRARMATHDADRGAGLVLLTGEMTSPTLSDALDQLLARYPEARQYAFEAVDQRKVGDTIRSNWAGFMLGARPDLLYDFTKADVIVSFGDDFLADGPGALAYARQFSDGRRVSGVRATMNRLYVAESDFTLTGARADHRLAAKPARVDTLLQALAVQMGVFKDGMPTDLTSREAAWLSAVAADLAAHRGRALVLVGGHKLNRAVGLALNDKLANFGSTVHVIADPRRQGHSRPPPAALAGDLRDGRIRTLLVLTDDPARADRSDGNFRNALAEFSQAQDSDGRPKNFSAHLGLYANQTAYACQWHVPAQHDLEMWGDACAHDGTASFIQPLIAPADACKSATELVHAAIGSPTPSGYDAVRAYWRRVMAMTDDAFEPWWTAALRKGVVEGTESPTLDAAFGFSFLRKTATAIPGVQAVLKPDPAIGDGSLFHHPWLQELPKPMTKIVWGNAALLSPALAERHGLTDGDVVKLANGEAAVELPVVSVPGIADDTVVLHFGYGHHPLYGGDAVAKEGNAAHGTDVYPLRRAEDWGDLIDVELTPIGRREPVIRTRNHHAFAIGTDHALKTSVALPRVVATPSTSDEELRLRNRKVIRTATLAEFFRAPDFAQKMDEGAVAQLYPSWDYSRGPQWGMTIDLTACIGCQACVAACQAENNIPSVGPEQVAKQREMHWLRVDSYLDDAGRVHHQPVPCMHCENAPCEYVCPVAATTHSVDGLNQMTYNRCVGTRYCSNNCPYKVRRFNFLNYTANTPESYAMQRNPDVTVRTRGVVEKCTYCVQRLVYADRKAEIAALNAGDRADQVRRAAFSRVQTACQQTCPTRAIRFGDLTDPNDEVTKDKQSPLNYGLLTELSTKPRTTYLASITNPSPSMEPAS